VADGVHPLAFHLHDGLRHPLLWSHRYGGAKVVYDALGHDQRSFAAPEHRRVVERSAQWLLAAE
jgi:type 1 glutamine amidotransferase